MNITMVLIIINFLAGCVFGWNIKTLLDKEKERKNGRNC